METGLSIALVASLILGFFYILYLLGKSNATHTHKVYGTPTYARLCMFADFVNKCGITLENYNNIQYELVIIKELKEMEDLVFSHKVNEIVKNFERRFKQWIPISDQKMPTN